MSCRLFVACILWNLLRRRSCFLWQGMSVWFGRCLPRMQQHRKPRACLVVANNLATAQSCNGKYVRAGTLFEFAVYDAWCGLWISFPPSSCDRRFRISRYVRIPHQAKHPITVIITMNQNMREFKKASIVLVMRGKKFRVGKRWATNQRSVGRIGVY